MRYEQYVRLQAQGKPRNYINWLEIEAWRIRNLMELGNCSIKTSLLKTLKRQFEYLFGEENLTYKTQVSDSKYSVISVNKIGKEKARPLIEV